MKDETKQVLEIVTDMQDQMVTKEELRAELGHFAAKDDFARMENDLRAEIRETTQAICELTEAVRGQAGFAKEIDFLMTRMTVVERHLGIEPNIVV